MTTGFIIITFIEIAAALLLIYGFMHEEELIEFETEMAKIIRFVIKKHKKARLAKKASSVTANSEKVRTNQRHRISAGTKKESIPAFKTAA